MTVFHAQNTKDIFFGNLLSQTTFLQNIKNQNLCVFFQEFTN